MTLIRRAGSFFAFTVVLACASDNLLLPPQGLKFAFAQGACGPADGPALTIFLTRDPSNGPSPVAPYVRIYISDAATVAPLQYTLLLWAVIFGWMFFGDLPRLSMLIGAALALASAASAVVFIPSKSRH